MFWFVAILAVFGCGVVLAPKLRASGSAPENATAFVAMRAFFRDQLDAIDIDHESGRISDDEAMAARAEIAREVRQQEQENFERRGGGSGKVVVWVSLPLVALLSLGLYAWVGRAELTNASSPRPEAPIQEAAIDLEAAIATIEARMVQTPDDVRGWLVLAPIYLEQGRYAEAASAWRQVLALEPPTADRQTDLAEALVLVNGGAFDEESISLLRSAAASDSLHVRSRFYLAGELTTSGRYDEAVGLWEELLGIATGEEAWVVTAREGLAVALAGARGEIPLGSETAEMVRGMVDGLAARLDDAGGSVADWMQLVRSRIRLDGADAARADLLRGLSELSGEDRLDLEALGNELGLLE